MLGHMSTPNTKLMIPDRAIASVVFGFLSILTFQLYGAILWNTSPESDRAADHIGSILGTLEITRRMLAVVALLWCVWSWRKEWWLPSLVATLSTAFALVVAFGYDS
jgi:hypothetical protein